MHKLLLVSAILLGATESRAQSNEPWQPFVLSRLAPTLNPAQIGVESGAGYNQLPQSKSPRLDDTYRGSSWISASAGLLKGVELSGLVGVSQTDARDWGLTDARAELRVRLLDGIGDVPLRVGVSGGYQRDWRKQDAAEFALLFSSEIGALRLVANARVAHYFHPGRDAIDLYATAGASYRVFRWLYGGVEYLGEELEGIAGREADDDARGGRHYVGPSTTILVPGSTLRFNVTGGPVFMPIGTSLLVRGSVGYVF